MKNADEWWESLSQEEQMKAFYSVVKRIVQGELEDKGSYRYVLYDVFGFGPESYGMGMNCGYMALHNAIFDGEEYQRMKGVNRLEVIGNGREFVKYLKDDERVRYCLQDDNRTLKVFIDKVTKVDI